MKIMTEHIPEQVIPAHDIVTELFKFDELDEDIRERLVSRCAECHAHDWEGEYRDTLKELEKLFGVKCVDWQVDGWRHDYTLYAEYDTYLPSDWRTPPNATTRTMTTATTIISA